jgi:hypothetical protein
MTEKLPFPLFWPENLRVQAFIITSSPALFSQIRLLVAVPDHPPGEGRQSQQGFLKIQKVTSSG